MKKRLTNRPRPIRIDAPTAANIQTIIDSGMASDTSAAFRAGVAALARGLVGDPRVWIIHISRRQWQIFATRASAVAWLESHSARYDDRADEWFTVDEDGDPFTWYTLEGVVPK